MKRVRRCVRCVRTSFGYVQNCNCNWCVRGNMWLEQVLSLSLYFLSLSGVWTINSMHTHTHTPVPYNTRWERASKPWLFCWSTVRSERAPTCAHAFLGKHLLTMCSDSVGIVLAGELLISHQSHFVSEADWRKQSGGLLLEFYTYTRILYWDFSTVGPVCVWSLIKQFLFNLCEDRIVIKGHGHFGHHYWTWQSLLLGH